MALGENRRYQNDRRYRSESEAQSGFDEDGRSERASLQRVTRRNR